jgi:hypothetical protein
MAGTADGDIVLFSDRSLGDLTVKLDEGDKCAVKYIRYPKCNPRVHTSAVTYVTQAVQKFVISGGEDGCIKVFDINVPSGLSYTSSEFCSGTINLMLDLSPQLLWIHTAPVSAALVILAIFDDSEIPELVLQTKSAKIFLISKPVISATAPFRPGTAATGSSSVFGGITEDLSGVPMISVGHTASAPTVEDKKTNVPDSC